jgi:hypothetical protein
MNSKEPSLRGGMNSLPSCRQGRIVAARIPRAPITTTHGRLVMNAIAGLYSQRNNRLIGLRPSGLILPLIR